MMIYAVCGTLSAVGLLFAYRSMRRRRFAAGLRTTALALLPMGLAMTGVIRFVLNMTINPIAWMGFGVLGMSVLLVLIARLVDARSGGRAEEAPAEGRRAAEAAPAAPELPSAGRKSKPPAKGAGGEDFSDIEAILKKHGI
ncbi:hypothetical protein PJ985_15410 [Streptomyces sp. ACA25]|uniref:hypothetical protein n=1 Tax=Streptomyces sp. ACA25 TaxID=3022596 RepID=UPI0023080546|nr:hypothetical protein [Streptomyces sp. ACA25]MDB1088953.1 hypothetical protein [Streptomyces sp. ACA25]